LTCIVPNNDYIIQELPTPSTLSLYILIFILEVSPYYPLMF